MSSKGKKRLEEGHTISEYINELVFRFRVPID